MSNTTIASKVDPDEPLALTVTQFTKRVGISRSSLYQYVKRGKIRVVSIAGRTLIPMTEVERLLSGGR